MRLRVTFAIALLAAILPAAQAHPTTCIAGTVEFRVLGQEPGSRAIPGARILVIGPDGRLLLTGLTDQSGSWTAQLVVPTDPRFTPSRPLGTVTAIAIANSYIERLYFDVPVTPAGTVQVVTLLPIQPHQRNEPSYELGMLHRLDVLPLLEHYAKEAGLGKQAPVAGDWNSPHWSPAKEDDAR